MRDLTFSWRKDLLPQRGRQGSEDGYKLVGSVRDAREAIIMVAGLCEVKHEVTFTNLRMEYSHLK